MAALESAHNCRLTEVSRIVLVEDFLYKSSQPLVGLKVCWMELMDRHLVAVVMVNYSQGYGDYKCLITAPRASGHSIELQ
jgi:hypothetical protein